MIAEYVLCTFADLLVMDCGVLLLRKPIKLTLQFNEIEILFLVSFACRLSVRWKILLSSVAAADSI